MANSERGPRSAILCVDTISCCVVVQKYPVEVMVDVAPYTEVLKAAQQLSLDAQAELAEELLRNVRLALRGETADATEKTLTPLAQVTREELQVLAGAVLAPGHQQQLHELLERNRQGRLTPEEEQTLDRLLTGADRVALLKARALYTLKMIHGQDMEIGA